MSIATDFAADLHVNYCTSPSCTGPTFQHRPGLPGSDDPTRLTTWVDEHGSVPFADLAPATTMTPEQTDTLSEGLAWGVIRPEADELWQIDATTPFDYGPSMTLFADGMVVGFRGEASIRPVWVPSAFYGLSMYRNRTRMIYAGLHRGCGGRT